MYTSGWKLLPWPEQVGSTMGSALRFIVQRNTLGKERKRHTASRGDKKQCQEKHKEQRTTGSCYGLVFTVAISNMK